MLDFTFLAVATALAVAVAVRSTWSPCGVSMLSTLTPLGERGRGHRWWLTCGWYAFGAVCGGAGLGAAGAVAAWLAAPLPASAAALLVTGLGVLALTTDLRLTRRRLPGHRRQVDDTCIRRYRRWVYAAGFGLQIGVGFATVIMTGGLYLLVALMALGGDPLLALLLGMLFGMVRGAAITAGWRLDSPARLRRFHARFDALAPASVALAVAAQTAVVTQAGWTIAPALGVAAGALPLAWFAVRAAAVRPAAPRELRLPIAA